MAKNLDDSEIPTPPSWPSVEAHIGVNWKPELTNQASPAEKGFMTQKH